MMRLPWGNVVLVQGISPGQGPSWHPPSHGGEPRHLGPMPGLQVGCSARLTPQKPCLLQSVRVPVDLPVREQLVASPSSTATRAAFKAQTGRATPLVLPTTTSCHRTPLRPHRRGQMHHPPSWPPEELAPQNDPAFAALKEPAVFYRYFLSSPLLGAICARMHALGHARRPYWEDTSPFGLQACIGVLLHLGLYPTMPLGELWESYPVTMAASSPRCSSESDSWTLQLALYHR